MTEDPLVNLRIREDADLAYTSYTGPGIAFSSEEGTCRIREIIYSCFNFDGIELRNGSPTPVRIVGRNSDEISDLTRMLVLNPGIAHRIASDPRNQERVMTLYRLTDENPELFEPSPDSMVVYCKEGLLRLGADRAKGLVAYNSVIYDRNSGKQIVTVTQPNSDERLRSFGIKVLTDAEYGALRKTWEAPAPAISEK